MIFDSRLLNSKQRNRLNSNLELLQQLSELYLVTTLELISETLDMIQST